MKFTFSQNLNNEKQITAIDILRTIMYYFKFVRNLQQKSGMYTCFKSKKNLTRGVKEYVE